MPKVQIYLEQQDGTIIIKERKFFKNFITKNKALKICMPFNPETSKPRINPKET